jgi:cell division protein FtsB
MLKTLRLYIIIGVLLLIFLPGFSKIQELRARLQDAEEKLAKTQEANAALEARINLLRTDKDSLEMMARERLGVVKKGETVIKIIRGAGNETAAPPAQNSTILNSTAL